MHQLTFPPTVHEASLFSTYLPAFVISRLFDDCCSNRCEVIYHCFLFLSMFSCTCWPFIFFRKVSRSFAYFPIELFAGFFVLLWFWIVWILYIFWILHLIKYIVCKDFSLSIHCLFALMIISFVVQRLLFWMVSLVYFYFDAGSLGVISGKLLPGPLSKRFFLYFLLGVLWVLVFI